MNGTEGFKRTIQMYLENRAKADVLFAKTYAKVNKNIDDCIIYILNTVKNSKCNGFADDEIYNMAVHYYDEDNVVVGGAINCSRLVINQHDSLPQQAPKSFREKRRQSQDNAQQLTLF